MCTSDEVNYVTIQQKPAKDNWSAQEKDVIKGLQPEAPELPYRKEIVTCKDGSKCRLYKIPQEDVLKIINEIFPYELHKQFTKNSKVYDLHSRNTYNVTELRILRWSRRNVVVSPDYPNTGGMVVDLMPPEMRDDPEIIVKVKGEKSGIQTIVVRKTDEQDSKI